MPAESPGISSTGSSSPISAPKGYRGPASGSSCQRTSLKTAWAAQSMSVTTTLELCSRSGSEDQGFNHFATGGTMAKSFNPCNRQAAAGVPEPAGLRQGLSEQERDKKTVPG